MKEANDFEWCLQSWFNEPPVEQSYTNFKPYFNEALFQLKKFCNKTFHNMTLQQANQVIELKAGFDKLSAWNAGWYPNTPQNH